MTIEEKNIRICEARGWSRPEEGYWRDPDGHEWQVMHGSQTYKDGTDILPQHFHNRDHIVEAINSLNFGQKRNIRDELEWTHHLTFPFLATATQLSEAYGQTLGHWTTED